MLPVRYLPVFILGSNIEMKVFFVTLVIPYANWQLLLKINYRKKEVYKF